MSAIIKYPISNEKAIRLMETENKLVFAVDIKATKVQIKDAIAKMFDAKVISVNTKISADGKKSAFVRFNDETPAIDIATNLGLI